MSKLKIITVPDPVLREKARPIESIDESVRNDLRAMVKTMQAASGIGLAANQVGILRRMVICHVCNEWWSYAGEEDGVLRIEGHRDVPATSEPLLMVNPEIVKKSEQKSVYEEGCLSLPQQYADVVRPAHVTVKYLDESGQEKILEASGLLSHCIQHEIDHLDGILFVDYLSKIKRDIILRRLKKHLRHEDKAL